MINRGEPAIIACHWPGIYFGGKELGLKIFQEVVRRVHARYDDVVWMKLSEIARYWAARELTRIETAGTAATLSAPFAAPDFTPYVACQGDAVPKHSARSANRAL